MKKLTIIISTFLILASQTCLAADPLFTIFPDRTHEGNKNWIILNTNPGKDYTENVIVKNASDQPLEIELQIREFQEPEGQFKILETEQYQNIGNWLKLPTQKFTLAAHEKQKIPVKISIPSTTEKGKYNAVILATVKETNPQNINIITRIGVRTYLTVSHTSELQTNLANLPFSNIQLMILGLCIIGLIIGLNIKTSHAE